MPTLCCCRAVTMQLANEYKKEDYVFVAIHPGATSFLCFHHKLLTLPGVINGSGSGSVHDEAPSRSKHDPCHQPHPYPEPLS